MNYVLFYYWIQIRYIYYEEEDRTEEKIFPKWQHLSHLNYNFTNFFFYTPYFYSSNITSSVINITPNTNIDNFNELNDEQNLIPLVDENFYDESLFLEDFFYLKKSSFINFFVNNMIDVPICFKKSHSLRNKNFELPILKFSNFLMKKGKREKIIRLMFRALRLLQSKKKLNPIIFRNEDLQSWLDLYFFTTNAFWVYNENELLYWSLWYENNNDLSYSNGIAQDGKLINSNFFIKNYLLLRLSNVLPVFSYFIYSVDKNIRKFSRGKSGKYVFIWKYVAPYKRLNLAMRWIVKDIKFAPNKKFSERFIKILTELITTPENSFAWKSKVFAHNYVFKNFRKSLMSSLKTTSK